MKGALNFFALVVLTVIVVAVGYAITVTSMGGVGGRNLNGPHIIPPDRTLTHEILFPDNMSENQDTITLIKNRQTTVRYSLEAQLKGESSGPLVSESARAALNEGKALDVVFRCSICGFSDNVQPPQKILFDRETLRTNEIEFAFSPIDDREQDHNWLPLGESPGVTLILLEAGVRHDQLHIPISLLDEGFVANENKSPQEIDFRQRPAAQVIKKIDNFLTYGRQKISQFTQTKGSVATIQIRQNVPFQQYSDSRPDLKIVVSEIGGGSTNIVVKAELMRPKDQGLARLLIEQLEEFGIDAFQYFDNEVTFVTSISGFDDLNSTLGETYASLSCLVRREGVGASVSRAATESVLGGSRCEDWVGIPFIWTADNRNAATASRRMYLEGRQLYSDLFGSLGSESKIRQLMDALADISGRRLSGEMRGPVIKIRTHSQIHIPVQLLHPHEENYERSQSKFLGLVFDIIEGKDIGQSYSLPRKVPFYEAETWNVVFGSYSGPDYNSLARAEATCDELWDSGSIIDRVSYLACRHRSKIVDVLVKEGRIGQSSGQKAALNSSEFESALWESRRNVNFVWTYTHGKTRFDDSRGFYNPVGVNPRLIFRAAKPGGNERSQDDAFVPARLRALALEVDGGLIFQSHPLVVLLACETGIPGSGTSGQSFAGKFINAGAFGVITTEAEIHDETADYFGVLLMEQFTAGRRMSPSRAVLEVRRNIFSDTQGNLWPLLFHYTGSHSSYFEN